MNSAELDSLQKKLQAYLTNLLHQPMINFSLVSKTLAVLKNVDNARRKIWNEEKFGAYDDMAAEALTVHTQKEYPCEFNSDDIPF